MSKKITMWLCAGIILLVLVSVGIYYVTEEPYQIEYLEAPETVLEGYVVFPYWYEECRMIPDTVHRYPLSSGKSILEPGKEGYLLYYRYSGQDGREFEFNIQSEEGNLLTGVKESSSGSSDELFAIVSFDSGTFALDPEPDVDMSWEHNEKVKDLLLAMETEPYEAEIQYLDNISDYPAATEAMEYWHDHYDGPSAFPVDDGYLMIYTDYKHPENKIALSLETSGSILSIRTKTLDEQGTGRVFALLPQLDEEFELGNIYFEGKPFSNYIVEETLQNATIGWTDWGFLLDAPDGLLSAEVIEKINFQYQPGPNSLHCIIRSTFETPEEMHFGSFLRYFQLQDKMTEEEKKALENSSVWTEDRGVDDLPVPTKPYRTETVNKVLTYYLGLTVDELNEEGKEWYIYFPEYDTYYTQSSDWGPGMFTCTYGEKEGTQVKLYGKSVDYSDAGGTGGTINSCIVLEEVDGRYLFRSHTELVDYPVGAEESSYSYEMTYSDMIEVYDSNPNMTIEKVNCSYEFNMIDESNADITLDFQVYSGDNIYPASASGTVLLQVLPSGQALWEGPLEGKIEFNGVEFDMLAGFTRQYDSKDVSVGVTVKHNPDGVAPFGMFSFGGVYLES